MNRVRELRQAEGWTQLQLAERTGVSRKTVNTIENGVFTPSTIVALKMARALGRSVEELFWLPDGEDARRPVLTGDAGAEGV